ncbi:hypothetical protein ACFOWM_03515 [Ferruginibacter yonginensis]|uniref:Uncharacterized protein n=1 Tax=Ferruginibacter yonginensis TaxID=1310416 RepID=A0ABV8QQN6_9BACT
MAYVYANLKTPQNVQSGVADYVLIAREADFAVDGIKCPKAPFTNPGDEVRIKEDHEFLPTKGFAKFALAPEKNQLSAKTIGDKGFQKLDFEASVFIPGSYAELHETVKNLMNVPLVALVKDSNCEANMFYQLGCDCVKAYLSVDFTTGTTKDGVKGYEGKLTYSNGYVQLYEGEITYLP